MSLTPLLLALGLQLAGGVAGLVCAARPALALRLGALGAVVGGGVGAVAAFGALLAAVPPPALVLPWPVPGGTLSLGIDPLSAVFLVPIFVLSAVFAVYGVGYLDAYVGKQWLGGQVFFYNLLTASMVVVVVAQDGVLFLVAWEVMSLASFFLVAFEAERPDVGEASRLYLIAAHLGAAFLFGFFALWGEVTGSFALVRPATMLPAATAWLLFGLALVGFGAKAGLWPLHVWLPKAHPAAPSHVSALMSGVMLKVGVYGLCRTLWLLGPAPLAWAVVLLICGAASALLGILGALGQRDLKALLAYSSGENIGVVLLGLGSGVLGSAVGQPVVAAAGYAGAFLHAWNHGMFKGLLFLGAGSVLHATHSRAIDRLGGLARRMPWTAAAFALAAAAIAGLPPLNGLVSEWLIYGALFRTGVHQPGSAGLLGFAAAAVLALVGGLALATFAKAVGVVFLGEPRTEAAAHAREAGPWMLAPMVFLAFGCLAVGLAPAGVAGLLGRAVGVLDPEAAGALTEVVGWTGPLARVGWCSAAVVALTLALLALRTLLLRHRAVAASPTWDCGYAAPAVSMQYTGSSFAEPAALLFRSVVRSSVHLAPPPRHFPATGTFATRTPDLAEYGFWVPLFGLVARGLASLRFLQGGRLQHYLLFLLLTLLALLGWALLPV